METQLTHDALAPDPALHQSTSPTENKVQTPWSGRTRLTAEDVARIVEELKADVEVWASETILHHEAVEAKLRRERAMGSGLLELKRAGLLTQGGRPPKAETDDRVSLVSLEDIGIRAHQSSRWQLEAKVPEAEFVCWIEEMKDCDGEISSAGLRRLALQLGLGGKSKNGSGGSGSDDEEFDDVDTDLPDGPCPMCGRSCDCKGDLS